MGYLNASQFRDEFTIIWDGLKVLRWLSQCAILVNHVVNQRCPAGVVAGQKRFMRGFYLVAPTGVDPVTFRFSVERSTN